MTEEFLHFIWLYQVFNHKDLKTVSGEKIQVISAGINNHNSGPDFSNSRIKIDNNLWLGNVEIHVNTSDWLLHQHQSDPAYSNVVLHVVYSDDAPKKDYHLSTIPVLELKNRIDMTKYLDWQSLRKRKTWIPCEVFIKSVPAIITSQMVSNTAVTRLERKVDSILKDVESLNGHWEHALMQSIITSMGTKVNKDAFHSLSKVLPFPEIKKLEKEPLKMEALVFGIAGFLTGDFEDEYPKMLKDIFSFQMKKFNYLVFNFSIWKFMRMRPRNFPSIRLAQLAAIFTNWTAICNSIFYEKQVINLEGNLRIAVNLYWKSHFRFDVKSKENSLKMGKSMYNHILINGTIPFIYAYGINHDDELYLQYALELSERISPEKNTIISNWNRMNIKAKNAFESQGLIELKNNFCSFKKCLSCKIGVWILNSKKNDKKNIRCI
jgi:hypothetical protein